MVAGHITLSLGERVRGKAEQVRGAFPPRLCVGSEMPLPLPLTRLAPLGTLSPKEKA